MKTQYNPLKIDLTLALEYSTLEKIFEMFDALPQVEATTQAAIDKLDDAMEGVKKKLIDTASINFSDLDMDDVRFLWSEIEDKSEYYSWVPYDWAEELEAKIIKEDKANDEVWTRSYNSHASWQEHN
jgi:hypothetical protein